MSSAGYLAYPGRKELQFDGARDWPEDVRCLSGHCAPVAPGDISRPLEDEGGVCRNSQAGPIDPWPSHTFLALSLTVDCNVEEAAWGIV